jgi:GNAT superfamily N-acetyltransferase
VSGRTHIVAIEDERSPLLTKALELVEETFGHADTQSQEDLRNEIEEKRLGLHSSYSYHLFVAARGDDVDGAALGAYLAGVNCGFITYIAVRPEARGGRIAQRLRKRLVEAFRASAREQGREDLDWVLGEVRSDSPWLKRLLKGGARTFDLKYYHPGMAPGGSGPGYTLYREPVAGGLQEFDAAFVKRIIYAIFRRAYRVRFPLRHPGFKAMMDELALEHAGTAADSDATPAGLPASKVGRSGAQQG